MSAPVYAAARDAYPRNLRAQERFVTAAMVEEGELPADALNGCFAEASGRAWAQSRPAPGARDRQLVTLRLASPKRADPARIVVDQADAAHLPLFVATDEPHLI